MVGIRKTHLVQFKTKIAIEAIKEHKTINELTTEYGIHASQLSSWKNKHWKFNKTFIISTPIF
jgi:transposase